MALRRAQYAEIREIDQTIQLDSLAILEEVMRHFFWKARILEGMRIPGRFQRSRQGVGRNRPLGERGGGFSGTRKFSQFVWLVIPMRLCCRSI